MGVSCHDEELHSPDVSATGCCVVAERATVRSKSPIVVHRSTLKFVRGGAVGVSCQDTIKSHAAAADYGGGG